MSSVGKPLQRTSIGVAILRSEILSYFCFLVTAGEGGGGGVGRRRARAARAARLPLPPPTFEPLPRQAPPQEVHEHVPQRLDVVPARLLDAEVGVDRRVARGARQVFVLAVGDVDVGARVAVLLGEAKVDDVDLGGGEGGGRE